MIRDLIPAPARQWVYLALAAGLIVALFLEDGFSVESVLKVAGVLGFGLAAGNVNGADDAG